MEEKPELVDFQQEKQENCRQIKGSSITEGRGCVNSVSNTEGLKNTTTRIDKPSIKNRKSMKSTIKDVAKLAGVSIKTVSRVTNQESNVKAETIQKVADAIGTLNYRPNSAARNLAGTRSYTLAYMYDNPNAYYVIDMQQGMLNECRDKGYELLIHPCDASSPTICDEIREVVKRTQLAGLIISPPLSEMPQVTDTLEELEVSFIRVISGSDEDKVTSPCVFIHDHQAAFEITEHLIEMGHQNIAFLSGDPGHHSTEERQNGYLQALNKHQIEPDPALVLAGRYSFESGVESVKKLAAAGNMPSALFACNDEIAAGALFAARLMNIDVPGQLAIAGFEDSPFSRQTWPKLTTAAQPTREIAKKAASALISHITAAKNKKSTATMVHQHFQPELVVRESTSKVES